jgi:hypothetical protein
VFLDFMQQRAQHLLGQPPRQLMNRCVCLIERGQQRRGRGSLPERDYRLVYGERGATQFIHHDGSSHFGCVTFAASAAGAVATRPTWLNTRSSSSRTPRLRRHEPVEGRVVAETRIDPQVVVGVVAVGAGGGHRSEREPVAAEVDQVIQPRLEPVQAGDCAPIEL